MKSIKFTEAELDFIRKQYVTEIEELEKYLETLKEIRDKLGKSKVTGSEEILTKKPGRPGRKPKLVKDQVASADKPVKKRRKPRIDKGVKRGKKTSEKAIIQAKTASTLTPIESAKKPIPTLKKYTPKKKIKKVQKKRSGVVLTNLRKPLTKKIEQKVTVEMSEPGLVTEQTPENKE